MNNRYRINSDDAISDSWLCALQSAHCFTFYFFVVFLAISSGWFQVSPSFFLYLFICFFCSSLRIFLFTCVRFFIIFFRLFFFPVKSFPFSYQQTSLFFSNISIYHFLVPLVFLILPFSSYPPPSSLSFFLFLYLPLFLLLIKSVSSPLSFSLSTLPFPIPSLPFLSPKVLLHPPLP